MSVSPIVSMGHGRSRSSEPERLKRKVTMLVPIILVGISLMVLERIIPDQKLPRITGWWGRVILVNLMQLGVVVLGKLSWDRWLYEGQLFHLLLVASLAPRREYALAPVSPTASQPESAS